MEPDPVVSTSLVEPDPCKLVASTSLVQPEEVYYRDGSRKIGQFDVPCSHGDAEASFSSPANLHHKLTAGTKGWEGGGGGHMPKRSCL